MLQLIAIILAPFVTVIFWYFLIQFMDSTKRAPYLRGAIKWLSIVLIVLTLASCTRYGCPATGQYSYVNKNFTK